MGGAEKDFHFLNLEGSTTGVTAMWLLVNGNKQYSGGLPQRRKESDFDWNILF